MIRDHEIRWSDLKGFLQAHGVVIDDDAEHIVVDCRLRLFSRVYVGTIEDARVKLAHPVNDHSAPKVLHL